MPSTSYLERETIVILALPFANLLKLPVPKMIKATETKNHHQCSVFHPGNGGTCGAGPVLRELLRTAKLLPSKGRRESKERSTWGQRISLQRKQALQAHHHTTVATEVHVCACVCVCMHVCPTEGQSISHKHYDSRVLKYPCKSPVVLIISPSKK